jgi:hypothetical protein
MQSMAGTGGVETISKRIIILSCFKAIVECPEDKHDIQAWLTRNSLLDSLSNRELQLLGNEF